MTAAEAQELRAELAAAEREIARVEATPLACECQPSCAETNRRNRTRLLRLLRNERLTLIDQLHAHGRGAA